MDKNVSLDLTHSPFRSKKPQPSQPQITQTSQRLSWTCRRSYDAPLRAVARIFRSPRWVSPAPWPSSAWPRMMLGFSEKTHAKKQQVPEVRIKFRWQYNCDILIYLYIHNYIFIYLSIYYLFIPSLSVSILYSILGWIYDHLISFEIWLNIHLCVCVCANIDKIFHLYKTRGKHLQGKNWLRKTSLF